MALSTLTRQSLVRVIVEMANNKARTIKAGDSVEVVVPAGMIPAGAHYGELTGELETAAATSNLKAHIPTSWTFKFTKL
jgi:hypothetical protein